MTACTNKSVYGVTTGFGAAANTRTSDVEASQVSILEHLLAGVYGFEIQDLSQLVPSCTRKLNETNTYNADRLVDAEEERTRVSPGLTQGSTYGSRAGEGRQARKRQSSVGNCTLRFKRLRRFKPYLRAKGLSSPRESSAQQWLWPDCGPCCRPLRYEPGGHLAFCELYLVLFVGIERAPSPPNKIDPTYFAPLSCLASINPRLQGSA
ncbi:uncharacterized protein MELLADRAFT_106520 [Melampsora larici-populina 98AG31]|uniref:Phenylalanine ammonia-lyase n=1 Tax=Melampsora larici-populina (strain 98AG31 / pathotype 3-4-7) TaxID=747676 RepID=F4RLS3_MELLP|nr:uncharacterized protein MELLADRAFT_106520 [Melampsora larici-populina 98AG31]EGG06702.1 hypothetical protein MELLADRAFT_106520 [Melampsora larici-populina 98AG31]